MTRFQPSSQAITSLGSAYGLTDYAPSYMRKAGNGDVYFYTVWQATKAGGEKDISNEVTRLTKNGKRLSVPEEAKLGDMGGFKAISLKKWTGSNTEDVDKLLTSGGPSSSGSSSEAASGGPTLDSKLLNDTWNDGTWTYKIDGAGNIKVKTTTYDKKHEKYAQVVADLNQSLSTGRLKKGSAPASASAPAKYEPPKEVAPPPKTSITDKVWFWPAVALVGVGTLTTGVIVWKRRRAAAS